VYNSYTNHSPSLFLSQAHIKHTGRQREKDCEIIEERTTPGRQKEKKHLERNDDEGFLVVLASEGCVHFRVKKKDTLIILPLKMHLCMLL
jgi:hypothetical protein